MTEQLTLSQKTLILNLSQYFLKKSPYAATGSQPINEK